MIKMDRFDYGIIADPKVFKINTLPAHADFIPYASEAECDSKSHLAKDRVPYDTSLRMSLNGIWKFSYANNIKSAIAGFEVPDYDCSGWDDIRVPSNIQFEGYDAPTYVNTQYPWEGHEDIEPGQIPEIFNPTGSYIRYFEIPAGWNKDDKVCISFQGVESGYAFWVNGSFAGYSEDSFTPSDFDITELLQEGVNKLAVQVYKWTSSSWLEDQDMFRLSGIFRDVYLYTKPAVHAEDIRIEAIPDETFKDGNLSIEVKTNVKTAKVSYELYMPFDCNDEMVAASGVIEVKDAEGSVSVAVANVKLWSAEKPELYELRLKFMDENDKVYEVVSEKIGFRKFEMKDGIMCLNGKRIVFYGVNRHEFSCDFGRSPRREEAYLDLCTMKQNNINAIRTCHYPDDVYIYHLCDELGIYLIAENNMETHGRWNSIIAGEIPIEKSLPGDNDDYRQMMLDRVGSTYERDKNHPAILIWSVGNESFGGDVIRDMADLFRKKDKERLVHYEGLFWDRRYNETSDMESQMYTSVVNVEKFLEEHPEKPFIMCEYMHAMGNSIGGMFKYIDLTERNPRFQGGFIWDYVDQSVRTKNRYGVEYQAYGGDIGRRPCDYNFSGNGIVDGTRKPYAKMQEVKRCYQPFRIDFVTDANSDDNYLAVAVNPKSVKAKIYNRNLFTDARELDFYVQISAYGREILNEQLDISVKPGEEEIFDITSYLERAKEILRVSPASVSKDTGLVKDSTELVIQVSAKNRMKTCYSDAGYEVAFGEKAVTVDVATAPEGSSFYAPQHTFKLVKSHDNIGVRGDNFEVLFSKPLGGIASYIYAGKEMIRTAPRPNFWRAAVENDNGNRDPLRMAMWKTASCFQSKMSPNGESTYSGAPDDGQYPKVTENSDSVEVVFRRYIATYPVTCCYVTYTVFKDGTVRVSLDYDKAEGTPDMPEFGFMFFMDADYDHATWYGMGPEETYCDKNLGGKLSVYSNLVKDNVQPYLVPEETGNKTGVRWAKVTDVKGRGLIFRGYDDGTKYSDKYMSRPGTMEFSALPYTPDQLDEAKHPYELPPVNQTVVRCILKQMGVGGDDTWGARPHEEFRISGGQKLHFTFEFKGI